MGDAPGQPPDRLELLRLLRLLLQEVQLLFALGALGAIVEGDQHGAIALSAVGAGIDEQVKWRADAGRLPQRHEIEGRRSVGQHLVDQPQVGRAVLRRDELQGGRREQLRFAAAEHLERAGVGVHHRAALLVDEEAVVGLLKHAPVPGLPLAGQPLGGAAALQLSLKFLIP